MQKLITGTDRNKFDAEVNELFKRGWRAVPGTLTLAIAATTIVTHTVVTEYSFAIVVEKYDK